MTIHISNRAKSQLTAMGVGGEKFLRITVVPGGCSGSTYSAGIDDSVKQTDRVFYEDGDFRAVADFHSAMYLDGLEIDYSDDLIRSGFRFKNPNAAKACGCGASFATLTAPGLA